MHMMYFPPIEVSLLLDLYPRLRHTHHSLCLISSHFLSLQSLILIFSLSQSHLFCWMWAGSEIIVRFILFCGGWGVILGSAFSWVYGRSEIIVFSALYCFIGRRDGIQLLQRGGIDYPACV